MTTAPSLLVLGASGHLGGEVARRALAAGHRVSATSTTGAPAAPDIAWHALDLRDRDAVTDLVRRVRPEAVVNTAYRQGDWAVTADGAAHAALAAAAAGARLVHVSSDAVFSGTAPAYPETALPDPVNPYGAAKAAAETAVKALHPEAVIARTSLIIGGNGSAHEQRVHHLAAGGPGALFTDDVRCPVHVGDLADALLELAASDRTGVHHLAGPDALSRHALGVLIARRDGLDPDRLPRGRRAVSGPPGPLDVRLDCTATRAVLRTRLRGARAFLAPR
ncbi:sugar nucleotide-binding protein [Nocardiopsis sp. NPDC006139]|uniref:sugar nucleotide-binding protein n=1 Tax=Nocardiopsis sp. NPDC006139 TaxID=3154578 RepID=UPI0033AD434C